MVLTTLRISKEMISDITNPDIVKDLMTQLMVKSYQCAEKAFNGVCKRHKIKKVCDLFYGMYRSLEDVQVRALACSLDNTSLRLFVTSLRL
jgi:hypothetical protein